MDVNGVKLNVSFKKVDFENDTYDYFMNISELSHLIVYDKKIFNKKCEDMIKYSDEIILIGNQYWMSYKGFNDFLLTFRKFNTDTATLIIGKYRNKINKIDKKRVDKVIKPYEYQMIHKKNGMYVVLEDVSKYMKCPLDRMINRCKKIKENDDILIYDNDYIILNKDGFNSLMNELNFKPTNKELININNRFDKEYNIYTIKNRKRKKKLTS